MKEIILLAFLSSFATSFLSDAIGFRPPGTVKIVDNFYIDEVEISNQDWWEFLNSLREDYGAESEEYMNAKPEGNIFSKEGFDYSPHNGLYFSHPAYQDYPIVGITHEQAAAFCSWRTDAVKKMMKRTGHDYSSDFFYRLPTQTEWELVANGGYNAKQQRLLEKNYKKKNYRGTLRTCNMLYDEKEIEGVDAFVAPTKTYLPNKFGVYNIYGNVAEMVADIGVAMGGSFRDQYEEVVPSNKVITYEGPQSWLGFRCVCEIMEMK